MLRNLREVILAAQSNGGAADHGRARTVGAHQADLLVDQQVTNFTASEFGRTVMPNGKAGTDHAWGGHNFIVGGRIRSVCRRRACRRFCPTSVISPTKN
jgi:hypothetical protein